MPVVGNPAARSFPKETSVILLAALALAPPQAIAPAAADARCIVVLGSIAARGNPQQVDASRRGILYFVGKLRGRNPSVNVAASVVQASREAVASKANPQAEVTRCGSELTAASSSLAGIRGTAQAPAPTPRKP